MVHHPIYGLGYRTGNQNGVFIEVTFVNDIGGNVITAKKNTLYVSMNSCR
jgi:hypothetical protein